MLPLVPGYLSLVSGVSVAEFQAGATVDTGHVLRSTLLFVAGFTLVFVALRGGRERRRLAPARHRQVLNRAAGIVVIVMGLFLAGLVSPRFLHGERRFHVLAAAPRSAAPPLMGMAFAFGWTPCIGPILAPSSLTTAATEETLGRGVGLLIAYSLGLGVPFVAAGLAFGRLTSVFGWVKRHFRAINLVSGLVPRPLRPAAAHPQPHTLSLARSSPPRHDRAWHSPRDQLSDAAQTLAGSSRAKFSKKTNSTTRNTGVPRQVGRPAPPQPADSTRSANATAASDGAPQTAPAASPSGSPERPASGGLGRGAGQDRFAGGSRRWRRGLADRDGTRRSAAGRR